MKNFLERFGAVLRARGFFKFVLGFFILESAWIALSAAYPQAFDEDFHFGIIKVYSHHWLPFFSQQPQDANAFGAVSRDPSYLYHYLMSFPYRLVASIIHGVTAQIIVLRLFNITLMAVGLVLFRRVFLKAGSSRALANVCLLVFVLIPIVPQLAGQINYDNLLFPLAAWTILLAMQARDELAEKKPSARTLLTLVAVCATASLVKYEFLPIAVGVFLFLLFSAYKNFKGKWHQFHRLLAHSWRAQTKPSQVLLVAAAVIGIGLFMQRDGLNLVKYHAIEPDCSKVLSLPACSAYGPWDASYTWHNAIAQREASGDIIRFQNPLSYTGIWIYWLWYRLFFTISGPLNAYQNYPPLPLPAAAGLIIGILGLIAIVRERKMILSNPYNKLFIAVIAIYLAALWISGYLQYRHTDVFVLMNGRYLLPVLLLIAAIAAQPLAKMLTPRPVLKLSLAAIIIFCFLEGGGALTFIMRSDPSWLWPNAAVQNANNAARTILTPVVYDSDKNYATPIWFFN